MTVNDLIDILSKYPLELKIAITGLEGGFHDVTYIDEMTLVTDYNDTRNGRGPHEDIDYVEVMLSDQEELTDYHAENYLVIK